MALFYFFWIVAREARREKIRDECCARCCETPMDALQNIAPSDIESTRCHDVSATVVLRRSILLLGTSCSNGLPAELAAIARAGEPPALMGYLLNSRPLRPLQPLRPAAHAALAAPVASDHLVPRGGAPTPHHVLRLVALAAGAVRDMHFGAMLGGLAPPVRKLQPLQDLQKPPQGPQGPPRRQVLPEPTGPQ
eukprot:gene8741-biopygen19667